MKCLVLVDFQNEWLDPKSDYYIGDISELISRTNNLINWARKNNIKIIFTKHIESEPADAFSEKSDNSKIINKINILESDVVVTKNKINPFYKTTLEKELNGVNEIIIAGILTNLCVRSLASDAYDRDFKITIIKDCCIAMDDEIHKFTLKDLKETRPEIQQINLEEI